MEERFILNEDYESAEEKEPKKELETSSLLMSKVQDSPRSERYLMQKDIKSRVEALKSKENEETRSLISSEQDLALNEDDELDEKEELSILPAPLKRGLSTIIITKEELIKKIKDRTNGFPRSSKSHRGKKYNDVFLGSEAVDWLLQHQIAGSVRHAVAIGNELLLDGIIENISGKHIFEDWPYLYRFIEKKEEKQKVSFDPQSWEDLKKRLLDPTDGVPRSEQPWWLKPFKDCFQGVDLVNTLLDLKIVKHKDREQATSIGDALLQEGFIVHVCPYHRKFEDSSKYYFFPDTDEQKNEDKKTPFYCDLDKDRFIVSLRKQLERQNYLLEKNSISGKNIVQFLLTNRYAKTRESAVQLGQLLRQNNVFSTIEHQRFEDFFYKLEFDKARLHHLVEEFQGDQEQLQYYIQRYGEKIELDRSAFKQLFGIQRDELVDKLFDTFDQDNTGKLNFDNINAINKLFSGEGGSERRHLLVAKILDRENNGSISRKNIQEYLTLSAKENAFHLSSEQISQLTDYILEEAFRVVSSKGSKESLSYRQFSTFLESRDVISKLKFSHEKKENLPQGLANTKMKKALIIDSKKIAQQDPFEKAVVLKRKRGKRERLEHYWFYRGLNDVYILVWLLLNIMLVIVGATYYALYEDKKVSVYKAGLVVAKGASFTIYLNGPLLLLLVSRNFLTKIRSTRVADFIPLDKNFFFHKWVAITLAVAALIHTGAHLANVHFLTQASLEELSSVGIDLDSRKNYGEMMFTTKLALPVITGIIMLLCMLAIFATALSKEFRSKHFNVFWKTHQLFILFYICLIAHGAAAIVYFPLFWIFFLPAAIIYGIEKTRRIFRMKERVKVISGQPKKSNVLELVLEKPNWFQYKSGQYLFLNWEQYGLEWHPFTITSSPLDDFLSLHIRAAGDWTKKLYAQFSTEQSQKEEKNEVQLEIGPQVLLSIDGPYGSASEEIYNFKYVCLIGAGIGITPFASILRDIINRKKAGSTHLKKVYLFWLNREQFSFEWFADLLQETESTVENRNLFVNSTFITGAHNRFDIRNYLLSLALDIHFEKTGHDMITNLHCRTLWGRPDWDRVFDILGSKHRGIKEMGVFFCGPKALDKVLFSTSKSHSSQSVRFVYKKENF